MKTLLCRPPVRDLRMNKKTGVDTVGRCLHLNCNRLLANNNNRSMHSHLLAWYLSMRVEETSSHAIATQRVKLFVIFAAWAVFLVAIDIFYDSLKSSVCGGQAWGKNGGFALLSPVYGEKLEGALVAPCQQPPGPGDSSRGVTCLYAAGIGSSTISIPPAREITVKKKRKSWRLMW